VKFIVSLYVIEYITNIALSFACLFNVV